MPSGSTKYPPQLRHSDLHLVINAQLPTIQSIPSGRNQAISLITGAVSLFHLSDFLDVFNVDCCMAVCY